MAFRTPVKWKIVLVVGITAYFISGFTPAIHGSEAQPEVEIPSPRHDAGTHWEGEVVKHAFEVRNNGSGELRILSVRPG